MSTPKDGGPAFPAHAQFSDSGDRVVDATNGMSLRDYFAAAALPSIISDHRYGQAGNEAACAYEISRYAGLIADAMLAERSK